MKRASQLGLMCLLNDFCLRSSLAYYTLAAGIAGAYELYTAVGPLAAGEAHLVGVDDDYIVTTLYTKGAVGRCLAAKYQG